MMLYVSLEQEEAVKNFFKGKGWYFRKPGKQCSSLESVTGSI